MKSDQFMKSDQEILRLFAEANPRPQPVCNQTPNHHDQRAIDETDRHMQDLPTPPLQHTPPAWLRLRVGLVMTGIVAGSIGIGLWASDLPTRDPLLNEARGQTPTTTSTPGGSVDAVGKAHQFLAARSAFDAEEINQLLGSGRFMFLGTTVERDRLAAYVDWLRVFDWTLTSPQCEETRPGTVKCSYTVSNRLSRQGNSVATGMVTYVTRDDQVVTVDESFDTSTYDAAYYEPFRDWVSENHPDSAHVMWNLSGDLSTVEYSDEARRLFDQYLTEYTSPLGVAGRYLTLRNRFDFPAMAEILGPGNFRVSGRVFRQAEMPSYFEWLQVFDWQLADPECQPEGPGSVTCSYSLTNRLTRHEGIDKPGTITVRVEAGQVTATDDPFDVKTYGQDFFAPFYEWAKENHPGSFNTMWLEFGGEASPRYSDESIRLFDELLTEYTGSPGRPQPDGR